MSPDEPRSLDETELSRAGARGEGPGACPPARRVVVALSGGVDSAVAAALLERAGHEVIAITLQLYDHGTAISRRGSCCAGQDIHDARRVADHLAIPHYVLDFERRFEAAVMAPFADSYLAGETPIPCIACNSRIKFRDLLDTARELGADVLATGHYVQRRDGPDGPALYRARDRERDQSYFLFSTAREQLARLWFPLGAMTKPEVRTIARELALPVADKPDSQDICFVQSGRYTDVVERLRPGAARPGDIVHVGGEVLGRHDGIIHYTVGQRRGLGLASREPLFVVAVDSARNRVVVGPRESVRTEWLELRAMSWIADEPLPRSGEKGLSVHVRVRSAQAPQPALMWAAESPDTAEVRLEAPEHGVAPGQACVAYADGGAEARLLGGGWIVRASGRATAAGAGGQGRAAAPQLAAAENSSWSRRELQQHDA
jgi:tRNA-specific 2-thiouridylase